MEDLGADALGVVELIMAFEEVRYPSRVEAIALTHNIGIQHQNPC